MLSLLAVMATSGCRPTTTDSACGPITRERLDPAYLVHVIRDDPDVVYTTDPPTSGPHKPGPAISGVVTEQLSRPIQVGVLERGDVLLQHTPNLDQDHQAQLNALSGPGVVVAPNADLPSPVVATAWTYKLRCAAVDVDPLGQFIDQRVGQGPEG